MSLEHVVLYRTLGTNYQVPIKSFHGLDVNATIGEVIDVVQKDASNGTIRKEISEFIITILVADLSIDFNVTEASRLMSDLGFDSL
jgi:hypothetical protein